MADGHSQSVCSIIRSRDFAKVEEVADHRLNLGLLGTAVTYDRALDLERRVFKNGQIMLGGDKEGYPTGVPEPECRLDIDGVKHLLDGHNMHFLPIKDGVELGVDLEEALVERLS